MSFNGRDARERERRAFQSRSDRARERAFGPQAIPLLIPRDRMGVPLEVGDLVLYEPPVQPVFEVVEIKPMLEPGVPPGSMTVVLATSMPVHLPNAPQNQRILNLIVYQGKAPVEEPPAEESIPSETKEEA